MNREWFANFAMTLDNKLGVLNERTRISNEQDFKIVYNFRNEIAAIGVGSNTILVDNPSLRTKAKYLDEGTEISHPVPIIFDRRGRVEKTSKVFGNGKFDVIWVTNSNKELDLPNVHCINYKSIQQVKADVNLTLDELGKDGAVMIEGGAKLLETVLSSRMIERLRIFTSSRPLKSHGVEVTFPTNIEYQLLSSRILANGIERIYTIT